MIASTPQPPYYAVIFTSTSSQDVEGYEDMADKMVALVKQQPGYLGHESARNEIGITISYWTSLDAIKNWKEVAAHQLAQKMGRDKWYSSFKTRICLVERDYSFDSNIY